MNAPALEVVRRTHPVAELLPLIRGDAFDELVADVKKNGLRDPIWIDRNGDILDGRNRYAACRAAGVEPRFQTFGGDDPIAFIISMNLHRRHLAAGQRAAIATELLPHLEKEARARRRATQNNRTAKASSPGNRPGSAGESRQHAAKMVGCDPTYVSDAKALKEDAPDLFEEVRAGARTLPEAKREAQARCTPGMFTSERDDWCTPPAFVEAVRQVFGVIELDPCSNASSDVGARVAWTEEDDGLSRDWTEHGTVYVNPPYGDAIGQWVDKCIESAHYTDVIALVPSRTDTAWFHRILEMAFHIPTTIGFYKGRLTFKGAPNPAPFPSAVVYWGERGEFQDVFHPLCTRLWLP